MGILIVDDAADNRIPLRAILQHAGYADLMTANSACDAFLQLGLETPDAPRPVIDVILMDIMMPEIDGIEACRRIKSKERLRDIPVIMVTSQGEAKDIESAFDAGAMDYITKPINVVELLARLRSALALKEEMDCRKRREEQLVQVTHELERANRKLRRLSSLDGLTGIANRRFFDRFLQRAWKYAARRLASLSVIMIDIDFFKDYNDAYGHQRGDACLRRVARALGHVLHRPSDCVARYGGEEFAVILSDTEIKGAGRVAEMLRTEIEALGIANERSPLRPHITISLGVAAEIPSDAHSVQQLLGAADQALYEAKRAGRNCAKAAQSIANNTPIGERVDGQVGDRKPAAHSNHS